MGHDVEEINAEWDEQVLERAGAIDVAKASAKVCVRLPGATRRVTKVWDVAATTGAIRRLDRALRQLRVVAVAEHQRLGMKARRAPMPFEMLEAEAAQHVADRRLLHVEDLAADGQESLEVGAAPQSDVRHASGPPRPSRPATRPITA